MAHIKTTATQVNSDTPNGAYLNFHDMEFSGVGVWHLVNTHPQFVHSRSGVVSYLVFDNWDAAFDWLADAVNIGDRVYEVREGAIVEVTDAVLNAHDATAMLVLSPVA